MPAFYWGSLIDMTLRHPPSVAINANSYHSYGKCRLWYKGCFSRDPQPTKIFLCTRQLALACTHTQQLANAHQNTKAMRFIFDHHGRQYSSSSSPANIHRTPLAFLHPHWSFQSAMEPSVSQFPPYGTIPHHPNIIPIAADIAIESLSARRLRTFCLLSLSFDATTDPSFSSFLKVVLSVSRLLIYPFLVQLFYSLTLIFSLHHF